MLHKGVLKKFEYHEIITDTNTVEIGKHSGFVRAFTYQLGKRTNEVEVIREENLRTTSPQHFN
ncbi:hypothetical protein [Virgibacillus halodenitrificans]|uniref:hypothetical protein n=1 Tax=Virgibacillus halodenitrificans TaxID=1482 RepID=UPI00076173B0